ncbi:MAG: fimbrillin family protein [Prevotella sp.]
MNKIYLTIALALLTGCSTSDLIPDTLSGNGKTPLHRKATLDGSQATGSLGGTRAADGTLNDNDQLLTYLRHVKGTSIEDYESVTADKAPKLVTFTTAGADALYWDDFSDSKEEGTDLRTANHGLQSYYGYCYNGGSPSTDLVDETGVVGWTASTDQTAGIYKYDLLWSAAQEAVTYSHATNDAEHGTITVPYTHAMSKFTIVVVADKGFATGDLDNTTVTLSGMNTIGTFSAPNATVTEASSPTDIQMYANDATTTSNAQPMRAFEAVAVPNTTLASGSLLATIKIPTTTTTH